MEDDLTGFEKRNKLATELKLLRKKENDAKSQGLFRQIKGENWSSASTIEMVNIADKLKVDQISRLVEYYTTLTHNYYQYIMVKTDDEIVVIKHKTDHIAENMQRIKKLITKYESYNRLRFPVVAKHEYLNKIQKNFFLFV